MRITIACPAELIADANHLAMILGYSAADVATFGAPQWRDAVGNLYAAASTLVFGAFIENATGALARPEWDTARVVDLPAAQRAQAVLAFDPAAPLVATPDTLTAVMGDDGGAALAAMGLTRISTEGGMA